MAASSAPASAQVRAGGGGAVSSPTHRRPERVRPGRHVTGRQQHAGPARRLAQHRDVRDQRRGAARPGLERRQAEPFVPAGVEQRGRPGEQRPDVAVRHVAEDPHRRLVRNLDRGERHVRPADEHEIVRGRGGCHPVRRHGRGKVLARVRAADEQRVGPGELVAPADGLHLGRVRGPERRVDRIAYDVDARRCHAGAGELPGHGVADGQHRLRPVRGGDAQPAVGAHGAGEPLRPDERGQVVDQDDAVRRGQGSGVGQRQDATPAGHQRQRPLLPGVVAEPAGRSPHVPVDPRVGDARRREHVRGDPGGGRGVEHRPRRPVQPDGRRAQEAPVDHDAHRRPLARGRSTGPSSPRRRARPYPAATPVVQVRLTTTPSS